MSKHIDKIKYIRVKQSLLNGDTPKQALLDANYSIATAHNATKMSVVKHCQEEIAKELQGVITVEMVLKRIDEDRTNANSKGDFSTALQADIALGKYLAMFTDKQEVTTDKQDNQFSLDRLSRIKLEPIDNKEDKQ